MSKSTKRASERDLNILHRLTVKGLINEFRRVAKAKEALPAALLNASSKVLALTGTTNAERTVSKVDRLGSLLKDYQRDADDDAAPIDPATDFSTTLPERDNAAPIPRHPSREFDDDFPS
jgi:hypothetical protein